MDRHGNFDEVFLVLELHKGKPIYCIYSNKGQREGIKGILKTVIPYDLVVVGDNLIPFVGPLMAIEAIFDENQQPIYRNTKADGYTGCSMRSPLDIVHEQNDILGYSVAWEAMEQNNKGKSR